MALTDKIVAIADAIREKAGTTAKMTMDEMVTAIGDIQTGGDPVIEELSITSNGTYTAPTGTDGYSPITVNVPQEVSGYTADDIANYGPTGEVSGNSTTVGQYAFYGRKITSATFDNCSTLKSYAFQDCSYLKSVSFEVLEYVEKYAFQYCAKLSDINFPNVTEIGNFAFQYCRDLLKVSFPKAIYLDQQCFNCVFNMTYAEFPSVQSISSNVFNQCNALTTLIIGTDKTKVCNLSSSLGSALPTDLKIYVPDDLVDSYKTATNWSTYADQIYGISEYMEA